MARAKCQFPHGMTIKPDGVNELDPCARVLMQEFRNVTVEVWQCPICGSIDISWKRQDDTEEVIFNDLMEE